MVTFYLKVVITHCKNVTTHFKVVAIHFNLLIFHFKLVTVYCKMICDQALIILLPSLDYFKSQHDSNAQLLTVYQLLTVTLFENIFHLKTSLKMFLNFLN